MTDGSGAPIRVLLAAGHPVRADDFDLEGTMGVEIVRVVRRLSAVVEVVDDVSADVVVISTTFREGASFDAMSELTQLRPDAKIVALTESPPDHADVARAIRAGAAGFVDIDAEPEELIDAVESVHRGETYLPSENSRDVLRRVADDLDVTTSERRSRLLTVAVGFVPLTGAIAAVLSLLWRKYLGHIGVRPVDLAIDPASRVIDTVANLSLFLGVFGPLLWVNGWVDAVTETLDEDGAGERLRHHRRWMTLLASLGVLVVTSLMAQFADLVLIVFVGPAVAVGLLAHALGLQDEIPALFRVGEAQPRRILTIAGSAAFVFLTILSTEAWVLGPDLDTKGANGFLAPQVLGFNAQPVNVITVDGSRPPQQLLYLGGNADLYVLVDPCEDDAVAYVSVGSSRLEVIDEVDCG